MAIQMTEDQLTRLLQTLSPSQHQPPPMQQGSFARCTARFDGSKDRAKLQEFITTTSIYKDIEGISDANALRGLPLLLEGEAATWWQGVQAKITTWKKAMDWMRTAFAPRKPAYQIYAEIFGSKQDAETATDTFITQKRALLADLPYQQPEEAEMDMIYSLLRVQLREKIPRDSVRTFDELIGKARSLEEIEKEINRARQQKETRTAPKKPQPDEIQSRCSHCRMRGHTIEECRRRKTSKEKGQQHALRCYGCGKPGYVRSKCPSCSNAETNLGQIDFWALNAGYPRHRPGTSLVIEGKKGYGFFDTGAKTSVASNSFFRILKAAGIKFVKRRMQITLADGLCRLQDAMTCQTTVSIGNRKILTKFVVLPDSGDNRTLLGIDFLEDAGIVINTPQRTWYFIGQPEQQRAFEPEPPAATDNREVKSHRKRRTPLFQESSVKNIPVLRTFPR
ncbi:Activity-regulated cytoskeleton associated protein 1 [Anthophora plagiata]